MTRIFRSVDCAPVRMVQTVGTMDSGPVILALATREFPRLRIGVGRGESQRDLADHVLAGFADDEIATLDEMTTRAADAAELFVESGIATVMNRFNAPDRPEQTTEDDA